MATNLSFPVLKLSLDLKNFRTVPQKSEGDAISAMITIKPERFHAIMTSIMDDGYIPTENIIVLKEGKLNVVKEGNRRVAALKLIHGQYKLDDFGLPKDIVERVNSIDKKWKKENLEVPCTIYNADEEDKADKVVALSHGKGEKAARDPWSSVATARHNRDAKGMPEPALDLLEKYLIHGNNLSNQQKERWAGDYPLTILHEAIRNIFDRLGYSTIHELVLKYPKIKGLAGFEEMLRDIGLDQLSFKMIRDSNIDFAIKYSVDPKPVVPPQTGSGTTPTPAKPQPPTPTPPTTTPPKAIAINDPKRVLELLKKFAPSGTNRQKVVTLRDELKKISIKDTPIAFCFLLRSIFEISAKAYCADHTISLTKSGGKEKTLVEVLRSVTSHITSNNANKAKLKTLHGALTELAKHDGVLSITSMNNLVHNPAFSIQPTDICILFGNVYPLLEEMN